MTEDIVHEATYPYPPAQVWRALVTPEALGSWLMENDFREAVVGHEFQFRDKPRIGWNGVTDCRIVEAVPEKRLAFTMSSGGDPPTTVTIDLVPAANGTTLKFRHSGFTGVRGWLMRAGMNHGWRGMVLHAIHFVIAQMEEGRVPPRDETTAVRKSGARGEAAAARAK